MFTRILFLIFFPISIWGQTSPNPQIGVQFSTGIAGIQEFDEKLNEINPIIAYSYGVFFKPIYKNKFSILFDGNYTKRGKANLYNRGDLHTHYLNFSIQPGFTFLDTGWAFHAGIYHSIPISATANQDGGSNTGWSVMIQKSVWKKLGLQLRLNRDFYEFQLWDSCCPFISGKNISLGIGVIYSFFPDFLNHKYPND